MPTINAVRSWSDYVRRHHCRNTQLIYIPIIWRFQPYMPEFMSELTCEHIENYLSTLKTKNRTINNHLITIKSFGHWCSDHGIPNPASKVKKLPEDHPKQRVLSEDEYEAVCKVATGRLRATFIFLCHTGLRISEFLALTSENISPDGKFLVYTGKGNKRSVAPLNQTCQKILENYSIIDLLKNQNYLKIYRAFRRLSRIAGLKEPFSPHSCRHYFATSLMRAKVDIFRISRLLHHSSVTCTESIYVDFVARTDLAGITDCLDK